MRNRSRTRGQQTHGAAYNTTRIPDTPSPAPPSGDYSYTLGIVMNMQHTMGKLTEAVENLKTTQASQGEKLTAIDKKIYAGIVLLTIFGAILTYFSSSVNSALTSRFPPVIQQQPKPANPEPTQASGPQNRPD